MVTNMGTSYIMETGLNAYAEANNIVVVYPQAADGRYSDGSTGCWDWDGSVVGSSFDTHDSLQLGTVMRVLANLSTIIKDANHVEELNICRNATTVLMPASKMLLSTEFFYFPEP